jgi:hypothetical protein
MGVMHVRASWCLRRLRRTFWLLGRRETRRATIAYLMGNSAAYAFVLSSELIHRAGSRRRRRAHAR